MRIPRAQFFLPWFATLPTFPIPAPKFCGRGRAFPPPQTHLPAPFLTTELEGKKRAHNETARSVRGYGLLLYFKHTSLTRVRALTSPGVCLIEFNQDNNSIFY